jgi:adenine-specific DNA-methyltransferase
MEKFSNPDNDPRGPWRSADMTGLASKDDRPNLHYDLEDPETGLVYASPPKGWRWEPKSVAKKIKEKRILFPDSPDQRPRQKLFAREMESPYKGFSSYLEVVDPYCFNSERLKNDGLATEVYTAYGTREVKHLFGHDTVNFPKPTLLVKTLIEQQADDSTVVLDYFAGSGTTGHAVIDLNREDGGERKYILVEMGEYFDTVLMPRIQKVVFAEKWKDGVPQFDENGKTGGVEKHIFKYQRLESYEDALNNIVLTKPDLQQHEFPGDYMLGYMLDVESRGSKSLLDIAAFDKPFDYKLNIQRGDVTPRPQVVDLQETFHYLIGMRVEKMEVREHQGREYRISRGQVPGPSGLETAVVVWRDLTPEIDWMKEKVWARDELLTEPVDRVYANGPSGITGYDRIEYVFKEKMDPAFGGDS